jgi:hypothetical protein
MARLPKIILMNPRLQVIDLAGCMPAGKLTVEDISETDFQDLDLTSCSLISPEDLCRITRKGLELQVMQALSRVWNLIFLSSPFLLVSRLTIESTINCAHVCCQYFFSSDGTGEKNKTSPHVRPKVE